MAGSGYLYIIGLGRSGTTLLSNLLNRSSHVFIAPETKFFLHVWSQRLFLSLLPRRARAEAIVERLMVSEYPRDPAIFPEHRDEFVRILTETESLTAGFPRLLSSLSDRPVLGEKTPWHTLFVEAILQATPDARFLAMTRSAPATVASTLGRDGFRRVGTVHQCVARWLHFNRELVRLQDALPGRVLLLRFEDLVLEPQATMQRVANFIGIPLEPVMLEPTHQDSSLRPAASEPGMDTGAVDRWTAKLSSVRLQQVEALTWQVSHRLGYDAQPAEPRLSDKVRVAAEIGVLRFMTLLMRGGLYPVGAATDALRARVRHFAARWGS